MARMRDVDRELLIELDELVDRCLASLGLQSTSVEGARQVAEILNRLPDTRARMVDSMRANDAAATDEVERSMYDFYILSRQSEATLLRLMDEVPMEEWAIALKGAEPALRDVILGAMPKRQAQGFEDVLLRTGPAPRTRIEQARAEIMRRVKALADAGDIELQLFAETVVL
jgi:flagellar motor switch protein FliG